MAQDNPPIEIADITFDLATNRLAFPFYGSLVRRRVLTEQHRQSVQVEPAFQFLDPEDTGTYHFVLRIAPGQNAYFARSSAGQPIFEEATHASTPGISADFPDETCTVCRVTVDLASWSSPQRVLTLRIYCNKDQGTPEHDRLHGVSLSLIRPGAESAAEGSDLREALVGSELTIAVTVPETVPFYDLFKSVNLPANVALEPAFRISDDRPCGTFRMVLADPDTRYKQPAAGEDQVEVVMRGADRRAELSRVHAAEDRTGARFTWQKAALPPGAQGLVFGFSLTIEKLTDAANGVWSTWRGLAVDPILFNDPPPSGW